MALIEKEKDFDYEEYIDWYERQPEKFVIKVWEEGYAEGIMQERNGIVDYDVDLPPTPSGGVKKLLEKLERENDERKNQGEL